MHKYKKLKFQLFFAYFNWRSPYTSFYKWYCRIWKFDLDTLLCCGGHDCGCRGATYYDMCITYLRKVAK